MTNKEAVDRFSQAHGAKIDKLFWIAGSIDNEELIEMIESFDKKDWKKIMPDFYNSESFNNYFDDQECLQALYDFEKYGFLAEIHIPECNNFRFDNGKLVSWSVHYNVCRIEHCYAETTEELMMKIETISKKVFKEYFSKGNKKGE